MYSLPVTGNGEWEKVVYDGVVWYVVARALPSPQ
jgi:hypothetical protein